MKKLVVLALIATLSIGTIMPQYALADEVPVDTPSAESGVSMILDEPTAIEIGLGGVVELPVKLTLAPNEAKTAVVASAPVRARGYVQESLGIHVYSATSVVVKSGTKNYTLSCDFDEAWNNKQALAQYNGTEDYSRTVSLSLAVDDITFAGDFTGTLAFYIETMQTMTLTNEIVTALGAQLWDGVSQTVHIPSVLTDADGIRKIVTGYDTNKFNAANAGQLTALYLPKTILTMGTNASLQEQDARIYLPKCLLANNGSNTVHGCLNVYYSGADVGFTGCCISGNSIY